MMIDHYNSSISTAAAATRSCRSRTTTSVVRLRDPVLIPLQQVMSSAQEGELVQLMAGTQ